MSYDIANLRQIIRLTLQLMDRWSDSAEELLMMTAAHESHGGATLQQVGGPAVGIYQQEPATEADLWDYYLARLDKRHLRETVVAVTGQSGPSPQRLRYDPIYATAMARVHYLRVPDPLPPAHDTWAMACYCKRFWNTSAGRATPERYLTDYRRLVLA